jgi:methylglutaconyl-CoA hydratase
VGAVPATIAAVLLPRLDPRAVQRYMLTGETFDVREALRIGLVTMAVPRDGVPGAVAHLTGALRLAAPSAVRATKQLVSDLRRRSLRDGLTHAAEVSARAFSSEDAAEGIAAFLEKRPPRWVKGSEA